MIPAQLTQHARPQQLYYQRKLQKFIKTISPGAGAGAGDFHGVYPEREIFSN